MILIVVFVGAAFTLNRLRHTRTESPPPVTKQEKAIAKSSTQPQNETPEQIRSTPYLERYIQDVIIHGSRQHLGFKYGDMPEKMADPALAPKIAAYVVTLSGRKPTHPEWVSEGRLYYTSNCGGCHGEDGKGVHGTFPDLTRDLMLGIEKRLEKAHL
ncbi:c-type cytochrome [Hydrogenimonas sp.]